MALLSPDLPRPRIHPRHHLCQALAMPRSSLCSKLTAMVAASLLLVVVAPRPSWAEPEPATRVPDSAQAPQAQTPNDSDAESLVVIERSIVQDQGGWQLDYRLRYAGKTAMVAPAEEIRAKIDAWVSNSRVANHAVPRLSSLSISNESDWTAASDVVASADLDHRCRERVTLQVWGGDTTDIPPITMARVSDSTERPPQPPLPLAPGAIVRVRLRFEHMHSLYGDYDPLLGQRTVELRLGSAVLRNVVPMDREQYLALPKSGWPTPPEDRRDTRHFFSGPDSLHLAAHIPGHEQFKFPERPVRYGTKMRLKFSYLIAAGTEGGCRVRISQSHDTQTSYRPLFEAGQEEHLARVGRWVKVDRILDIASEATSLALEFKLCDPSDSGIGEAWIDDVSLEPLLAGPAGP